MATIDVKDAGGLTVAIEKPLVPGRAAAASSRPVVLSTEDIALQGALTETAPATDIASSGLNGRLQRIAQRLTSLIALLPAALTGSGNFKVAVQEALPAGTALIGKTEISSATGTRVEMTITTGGTARNLFSATPTNGYEVINTHATEILYFRESASAATVADNSFNTPVLPRSSYTTPTGYKPVTDVSVNAATTGHALIGRRW